MASFSCSAASLLFLTFHFVIVISLSHPNSLSSTEQSSNATVPSASISPVTIPVYHITKFIDPELFARNRFMNSTARGLYTYMPLVGRGSEYVAAIRIGSNRIRTHLLLDTGSPLIWWQCQPCKGCYFQEKDPYYNFQDSKSFKYINCLQDMCNSIPPNNFIAGCCGRKYTCQQWLDECSYGVRYEDGDFSQGFMANETISNDNGNLIQNITFGCAQVTAGKYTGLYAGILGFQQNRFSFPNQVGAYLFSFCLVKSSTDSAPLYLYNIPSIDEDDAFLVQILPHPSGHYYIEFNGISIGGITVAIDPEVWKINPMGKHGVIIDTGTVITRFPKDVYNQFRDFFIQISRDTSDLKPSGAKHELFDTCYKRPADSAVNFADQFPVVYLHFGPNKFIVKHEAVIVHVGQELYCLAFMAYEETFTILGSLILETTRLSFDLLEQTITFIPDDCW